MSKRNKRAAQNALDGWVLNMVAAKARESVPRGDQDAAFSAFCSEVAADKYLSSMPLARRALASYRSKGGG